MEALLDHSPHSISSVDTVMDIEIAELEEQIRKNEDLEAEVHANIVRDPSSVPEAGRLEMIKTIQSCRIGNRALMEAAKIRGFSVELTDDFAHIEQERLF